MLEVIIERWTSTGGSVDYLWSLWRDGERLDMAGAHATAEAAESEARAFCLSQLGAEPDRVTRL